MRKFSEYNSAVVMTLILNYGWVGFKSKKVKNHKTNSYYTANVAIILIILIKITSMKKAK